MKTFRNEATEVMPYNESYERGASWRNGEAEHRCKLLVLLVRRELRLDERVNAGRWAHHTDADASTRRGAHLLSTNQTSISIYM